MKISLIQHTQNAKELLIFSKNTRHLSRDVDFKEVLDMPEREKDEQIEYVFNTISSSWEFVNYTFLIQDVTRSYTHQLVRHRIGTSFAQQSLRVASADDFAYLIPDKIEEDDFQLAIYNTTMGSIQEGYNLLLNKGADTQDARGVLPTNICTNILLGINLRALALMMETRLCIRAQGEFQQTALLMKDLVLDIHPWTSPVLWPGCIASSKCLFPRFTGCPLKNKYEHLHQAEESLKSKVADDWKMLMEHNYSPQPVQSK